MSDYPGGWFGESWGAPANDPDRRKPTPVGDKCGECDEPIKQGDQGMLIPLVHSKEHVDKVARLIAYHRKCFLISIGISPEIAKQVQEVQENRKEET